MIQQMNGERKCIYGPWNITVFGLQEGSSAIYDNMDETGGHFAK